MIRLLTPEPLGLRAELEESQTSTEETGEFEVVLGRTQMASFGFVAFMLIAAASGASYLIGKATSGGEVVIQKAESPVPVTAPASVVAPPADPVPAPVVEASIAPPPPLFPAQPPDSPILSEPVAEAVYIQMGAVEKGVAVIFAEGLRKRGFDAFVASGPNEKIFRVLIGPFPSAEAYQVTKKRLDDIGLSTFARRYQK